MAIRAVGRSFMTSVAYGVAADVGAAAVQAGDSSTAVAVFGGAAAVAGARRVWAAHRGFTVQLAALPRGARAAVSVAQLGGAAAAACLLHQTGVPSRSNEQALGEMEQQAGEEVPLAGRRRMPLPAALSAQEDLARQPAAADAWFERAISVPGEGTRYLPGDHLNTREAQAQLHAYLAAAVLLTEEQHGPDSAAAQRARQLLASPPPLRVFATSGERRVDGFASSGCIAVHTSAVDTADHTIAHEVAHVLLRHVAEETYMNCVRRGLIVDRGLWFTSLLAILRPWTAPSLAGSLALGFARAGLELRADGSLPGVNGAPPLEVAPPPGESVGGHPAWLAVAHELEADRVALLLMARAGHDPLPVVKRRMLADEHPCQAPSCSWRQLRTLLMLHAQRDAAALALIDAGRPRGDGGDGDNAGGVWPNSQKQALNFAEALPRAVEEYEREMRRQRLAWWAGFAAVPAAVAVGRATGWWRGPE